MSIYYVDADTGDNLNDGLSKEGAWETSEHAEEHADDNSTINYVRDGAVCAISCKLTNNRVVSGLK